MLRRLVRSLDTVRESRWVSAYLGCTEARDRQSDEGHPAKLDFSNIRHRGRCDRKDLNFRLALAHHARHRVDVATDLPVDRDHRHHKLRRHIVLPVDIHAMSTTTTLVGSSDPRHLH